MNIKIVERKTRDWANMTGSDLIDHISNDLVNLKDWERDNYLSIAKESGDEFCDHRAMLKEIAHENWAATGIPVISIDSLPIDDTILLPTDDDDLYSPRIRSVIESHFTDSDDVVFWDGLNWNT